MALLSNKSAREDTTAAPVDSDPNRSAASDSWALRRSGAKPQPGGEIGPAEIGELFSGQAGGRAFRWLLNEGRLLPDLASVVAGIAQQLTEGGMPLHRFFVGQRTLHPQMGAIGYLWNQGDATSQTIEREYAITTT